MKALKILLVIEASGGAGRHVADLAEGLAAHGHNVHLIYSPVRADKQFMARLWGMKAVTSHPLPMARGIGASDLASWWRLRQMVSQLGPFDLVHAHSSKAGGLVRLLPRGVAPWPRIYTPHAFVTMDPKVGGVKRALFRLLEKNLDRWGGHHLIAVSEDEVRHATELGIARDRVSVVVNGIDLDLTSFAKRRAGVRKELGIADDELCIGYVGRLTHQKAPEVLIEAFRALQSRDRKLKLVMLGDGELRDDCVVRLGGLIASGAAHLLEGRTGVDYMPGFDLFALSSRYEGMAYVHLEAAAMGLPIVTTDVAGARTVVAEGENGFFAEPGSIESFVHALEKGIALARKPIGRVTPLPVPTTAQMVSATLEIYCRAVEGTSSAA